MEGLAVGFAGGLALSRHLVSPPAAVFALGGIGLAWAMLGFETERP